MTNEERANGKDIEDHYRLLPSLNELLLTASFQSLLQSHSRSMVVASARATLGQIRQEIADAQHTSTSLQKRVDALPCDIASHLATSARFSLQPVINATGVILHTNLGRAPLSQSALDHVVEVARGYCNLELDLESGERSRRDVHAEPLILRLLKLKTGMLGEDLPDDPNAVVIVNNCAAATFLALNTLADGAEVVVSRGELVEIGGGFRVPEILAKSGALLREVGTTNRTRVSDYENAISPHTALLLRVHQSNFSIEGFTTRPKLQDLVSLGQRKNVPVFEDQGTGLMFSLERHGIKTEETFLESFRHRADLIAASGDKLLGGPQCGILVGRKDLIERIRNNPLLRAFRVDKLTYAALEATLMDHLSETESSIPMMHMLSRSVTEIERRCQWVASQVHSEKLAGEVVSVMSLIGGGTTPGARLQSHAVSLQHAALGPRALLHALRRLKPPVIGRISDDKVLLDLRTVEPEFDAKLARLLHDEL